MQIDFTQIVEEANRTLPTPLLTQVRYARLGLTYGEGTAHEMATADGERYVGWCQVVRNLREWWEASSLNADHWYDIQSGQWSDRAPEPWFDDFGETDADGVVLVHEPDWEDYRLVEAAEISREIFGDLSRYL